MTTQSNRDIAVPSAGNGTRGVRFTLVLAIMGICMLAMASLASADRKHNVAAVTAGEQQVNPTTSTSTDANLTVDNNPVTGAIDGINDTRWATYSTTMVPANAWIELDLGSAKTVDKLRWMMFASGGLQRGYPIVITAGNTPAPTDVVFTGTLPETSNQAWAEVTFTAATARYWRVRATGPSTGQVSQFFGAWEVELVNTAAAQDTCVTKWSDEFDGTSLDSKWLRHTRNGGTPTGPGAGNPTSLTNGAGTTITNPNGIFTPTLSNGQLQMRTHDLEIDAASATTSLGPITFLGLPVDQLTTDATYPGGLGVNYQVETQYTTTYNGGWQNSGLGVWQADGNFFRSSITHSQSGSASRRLVYLEQSKDNVSGAEGTRVQGGGNRNLWLAPDVAGQRNYRLELTIRMRYARAGNGVATALHSDVLVGQFKIVDMNVTDNMGNPIGDGAPLAPFALDTWYSFPQTTASSWAGGTLSASTGRTLAGPTTRRDGAGTMIGIIAGSNFPGNTPGAAFTYDTASATLNNFPAPVDVDYFRVSPDPTVACEEPNSAPSITSVTATPDEGNAPLEVDFAVTATDADEDELEYEWDFDDGSPTSDEEDPTHTYTDPGVYEATVTVTDGELTDTDSVEVTVTEAPVVLGRKIPVKAVTVGSHEVSTGGSGSHNPAAGIIDGNFSTRHTTTNTGTGDANDWFEFDLGSSQTIDTLKLSLEAPEATYPIRINAGDTTNPTTEVFNGDVVNPVPVHDMAVVPFNAPITARYVRVYFKDVWQAGPGRPWDGSGQWFGTWEAAVYNSQQTQQNCVPVRSDEFNGSSFDGAKWNLHSTTLASSLNVNNGVLSTSTGPDELDNAALGPVNMFGSDFANFTTATTHSAGAVNWVAETEFTADFKATATPYGWPHVGLIVWQSDGNFFRYTLSRNNGSGVVFVEGSKDNPTNARVQSANNPTILAAAATQPRVRIQMRFVRPNTNVVAAQHRVYNQTTQVWGGWSTPVATSASVAQFRIPDGFALNTTPRRDSAGSQIGFIAGGTLAATTSPAADVGIEYLRLSPDEYTGCVNDTVAPTTTAALAPAAPNGSNGWYNSGTVTASLSATDNVSNGSRISVRRSVNTGVWDEYAQPHVFGTDGTHTFAYRSQDAAENLEAVKTATVKIDTVAPTAGHTLSTPPYVEPVGAELTITGSDATSGVDLIEYSDDAGATWEEYTEPVDFGAPGNYSITYRVTDEAGNVSTVGTATFTVEADTTDTVAPVSSHAFTPPTPNGAGGAWLPGVQLSLSATDNISIPANIDIEYSLNSGTTWLPYSAPVTFNTVGSYTVLYRATDEADNVETPAKSVTFEVSDSGPCVSYSDEFNGTALDASKWNFRHTRGGGTPASSTVLGGGKLTMTAGQYEIDTDNASTGVGPVNFIGQDLNQLTADIGTTWTVETQFTVDFKNNTAAPHGWQHVALIAWNGTPGTGPDNNHFRFGVTRDNANGRIYVQGTRDIPGGTANEGSRTASSNDPNVRAAATSQTPLTIRLRLVRSGGDLVVGSYSAFDDGTQTWGDWVSMDNATSGTQWRQGGGGLNLAPAGGARLDAAGGKIGLIAAGQFTAPEPATVDIEYFRVTPDDDCEAPVTTHSITPAAPDGPGGTWMPGVSISLSASDNVSAPGNITTQYSTNGGSSWQNYTGPIVLNTPGSQVIDYRSTDQAGNVETAKQVTIVVAAPATCLTYTDEFNGAVLGDKWWRHTRAGGTPAASTVLGGGNLLMRSGQYEIDTDNASTGVGPVTFIAQDLNQMTADVGSTWEVETQFTVDFKNTAAPYGWQHVGLMVWNGTDVTGPDNNHFRFGVTRDNGTGHIYAQSSRDVPGGTGNEGTRAVSTGDPIISPAASTQAPLTIRLRLTRSGGDLVVGSYSLFDSSTQTWSAYTSIANGGSTGWRHPAPGLTLAPTGGAPRLDAAGGKIGLIAGGNFTAALPAEMTVDYFRVTPDEEVSCPPPDTIAPESTHSVAPAAPGSGWYSDPAPTVTLNATDDFSGVNRIEYRLGTTGTWSTYSAPVQVTAQGTTIFQYRAIDNNGNVEEENSFSLQNDSVGPIVNHALDPALPDGPGGIWWEPGVELAIDAADAHSGVAGIQYSIDGGYMYLPYDDNNRPSFDEDGVYEVFYRASDVAGNWSSLGSVTFNVGSSTAPDNLAPVTSANVTPAIPNGSNGWYNAGTVSFALSAIDAGAGATGVDTTNYRIGNDGDFDEYTAAIGLATDGVHDVQYFSDDNAGNVETVKTTTIRIDTTKPNTSVNLNPAYPGAGNTYGSAVQFSFAADDATSGVAQVEYRVNGGPFLPYGGGQITVTANANYLVEFRATDVAGNIEDTDSVAFSIDSGTVVYPPVIPIPVDPVNAPFPITLQMADGIDNVQYSVEFSRDNGLTWEAHTAWSPYSGTVVFNTPGKYRFHYRWEVGDGWSPIQTLPFTVKGTPPPPTTLSVSPSPASKTLKANKKVSIKVKVTNTGNNVANTVKVCAKAPSSQATISGNKCRTIGTLAPGASSTLTYKIKKKSKGNTTTVKFTVTSTDAATKNVNVKLKLKK